MAPRRSSRETTRNSTEATAESSKQLAQQLARKRVQRYQKQNPGIVVPNSSTEKRTSNSGEESSSRANRQAEEQNNNSDSNSEGQTSPTRQVRQSRPSRTGGNTSPTANLLGNSVSSSSQMTTNPNPLAKLPLKGSGKGPKFPESVTGQGIKDFIDDVEEMVRDVPEIRTDDQKKEALLRYLGSDVKNTWKAIDGYDGGTYQAFKENILLSYDHTEVANIKKLDEILKKYRHLRVSDLDRILDLRRELGPLKKSLIPKNRLSNREFVQKILKTLDEDFCAEVWSELARTARQKAIELAKAALANPNAVAATTGHKITEDDPIGLDELLEELELQARVYNSEHSVMGIHIMNRYRKSAKIGHSEDVKFKVEQRENDIAQLKDVLVIQQKETDRRHKELLESVMKMYQELKVTPAYQQRAFNNNPSTYNSPPTPSTSLNRNRDRDVDHMIRELICWFCGERGHMSGRCLCRQKYIDEGKIILRGSKVCLPNGQSIFYSVGGDCQKLQVDKIIRETQQSNMYGEVLSAEDLASTPLEEVQAYLEALKERKKITVMIQQMRDGVYDDEDENTESNSVNIQTRHQAKNSPSESGF